VALDRTLFTFGCLADATHAVTLPDIEFGTHKSIWDTCNSILSESPSPPHDCLVFILDIPRSKLDILLHQTSDKDGIQVVFILLNSANIYYYSV